MLALIVVEANPVRAQAALAIAAAAAALGREVTLLFDGPSAALLDDLGEALTTAQELGVQITACATGLSDLGRPPPPGIATGGLVAFLAASGDAQPVIV